MADLNRTEYERSPCLDTADTEISALFSLLIKVSAAKRQALELMHAYPEHACMCLAIIDVATECLAIGDSALAEDDEGRGVWRRRTDAR